MKRSSLDAARSGATLRNYEGACVCLDLSRSNGDDAECNFTRNEASLARYNGVDDDEIYLKYVTFGSQSSR